MNLEKIQKCLYQRYKEKKITGLDYDLFQFVYFELGANFRPLPVLIVSKTFKFNSFLKKIYGFNKDL